MKTIKLTAKDFRETNSYCKEYCGKVDVSDFDGTIEIEANLGWVKFDSIKVTGGIYAEAGTSIEAGWGIEAGWSIEAGGSIKAGGSIEAGWGIEAGGSIVSGLGITCKLALSFKCNLFAGVAWYRKAEGDDKKITCGRLEGGTVCYGDVVETGMPDETPKGKTVKVRLSGGEVVSGEVVE